MNTKSSIIEFLSQNKEKFKNLFLVDKIALFGSYARNTAKEISDIDIAVEYSEDSSITFAKYLEFEEYLTKGLNAKVDIVDFKYMNPLIKKSALKDLIYV